MGYSVDDEKQIKLLQAEVLRATGKDSEASSILVELSKNFPLREKYTSFLVN